MKDVLHLPIGASVVTVEGFPRRVATSAFADFNDALVMVYDGDGQTLTLRPEDARELAAALLRQADAAVAEAG